MPPYKFDSSRAWGRHYGQDFGGGAKPLIFAVASGGAANNIGYSLDGGATWIRATVPGGGGFQGAAFSRSLKRAVATNATGGAGVMISSDGITWVSAGSNLTNGNWRQCCRNFDDTLFVVVGIGGVAGQRVATSPDGVTWTLRNTPNIGGRSTTWIKVSVDPKTGFIYAADTTSGNTFPTIQSQDGGITWAHVGALPVASDMDAGFAYWPDQNVIRGTGSGNGNLPDFFSTDNGATWTQVAGNPPMLVQPSGIMINPDNGIMVRAGNAVGGGFYTMIANGTIPPNAWTQVFAAGAAGPSLYSRAWGAWLVASGSLTVARSISPTAANGTWAANATGLLSASVTDIKEAFF